MGEEELSTVDLYGIQQDANRNYWLASNNGILRFDGHEFKRIPCRNQIGNSVFGLTPKSTGELFCFNLSGQIIEIYNDSAQVIFQIPDSLMSAGISILFDEQDEMVVATDYIFRLGSNNEITMYHGHSLPHSHYGSLMKLENGGISCFDYINSETVTIVDAIVEVRKTVSDEAQALSLEYYYLGDSLFSYTRGTGRIILEHDGKMKFRSNFIPNKKEGFFLFYGVGNEVWVSSLAGGVQVFNEYHELVSGSTVYFQNEIVSCMMEDQEGNILIGTFKSGIIVLPNRSLQDLMCFEAGVKLTKLTSSSSNVFVGTQDGRVLKTENGAQTSVFRSEQVKNVESLDYLHSTEEIMLDEKSPTIISLITGEARKAALGSVKDVEYYGSGNYLVATSSGVFCRENPMNFLENFKIRGIKDSGWLMVDGFGSRTNCVGVDLMEHTLYTGTPKGLKMGNGDSTWFYVHNGHPVLSRDIKYHQNRTYVATQDFGILVFEKNQVVDVWDVEDGLQSNYLNQLEIYKDKFYVSSQGGFSVLNKAGQLIGILTQTEGLLTKSVTDFEIFRDTLWMLHQRGIQKIALTDITQPFYQPQLELSEVLVNGKRVESALFAHDQNRLEFKFNSSSLKYRNDISYQFQLEGIDEGWQMESYENNTIDYKSLPSGSYVFRAKSVCRGTESAEIEYRFEIEKPAWQTWWFYSLMALVMMFIALGVFMLITRRQRRKDALKNELNASKLTAIQSQMNPHFIFNALNSIQDLVLKGDVQNSYSFITKFANLIRKTLNYSDKDFIDFDQELTLIDLYLSLEKLRFKDDFEYEIVTNGVEDILVPPMLIQPFIENALVHGLLHREGLKKLKVVFQLKDELECSIIDNGVGRARSKEINDRKRVDHESFSISAIKRRFAILQDNFGGSLGFEYVDLEEDGEPTGTKVILRMPVKRDF